MPRAPDPWRIDDDFVAALEAFQATARQIVSGARSLRDARPPTAGLVAAARESLDLGPGDARAFFTGRFEMRRLPAAEVPRPELVAGDLGLAAQPAGRPRSSTAATGAPAFLTGYYEPVVAGSLTPGPGFEAPILARPPDLAERSPYPARAEIEDAGRNPIVWLTDAVEVFLIHVQGSARVALPDGRQMRLVYDGRNGQPYTSIGRILIGNGEIPEAEMSLARLKEWLRAHGLRPGEPGRELMRRNLSYIFFRLGELGDPGQGPTGGAGVPLTPLRSLAVDRTIWSYGLPFWIEAELPDGPFRRLMIAQDTGSAIVGEARFDLFLGTGDEAGARAGAIRHPAKAFVLEPREARA